MSTDQTAIFSVDELIARWQKARQAGLLVSLEDLCGHDPHLVAECKKRLISWETDLLPSKETSENSLSVQTKSDPKEQASSWPGSHIGAYQLLGPLGKGGMGEVYKARQEGLDRLVAIKVIRVRQQAHSADTLKRFRSEAQALAKFSHPHVVQVIEVGEEKGNPYLVMEFIDGLTLQKTQQGKPLAPKIAAEIAEKLAEAVHALHEQGIIHRDLKPANVLLDPRNAQGSWNTPLGCPKIIDFGLVKQCDVDLQQTLDGQLLGTAGYMAPEQARGDSKSIDRRTDVYALGAILFEMLMGEPPFTGSSLLEVLEKVKSTPAPNVSQLRAQIPAALAEICSTCLEKRPEDRYASCAALAQALRDWRQRQLVRFPTHVRTARGRWFLATGSALGFLALLWIAGIILESLQTAQITRAAHPGAKEDFYPTATRAAPPATSRGTPPSPTTDVKAVPLQILHLLQRHGKLAAAGELGSTSFSTQLGDRIEMEAHLPEPAYSYLIVFRPDGKAEICYPEEEGAVPPLDCQPRYPPQTGKRSGNHYALTDGAGLCAVALLSSSQPLPPFSQWRLAHAAALVWTPGQGTSGVVYWHDGEKLQSLVRQPTRSKDAAAPDKTAVLQLANQLKAAGSRMEVKIVAFQVDPAQPPNK
jgi:serine/threonine protein kinase